MHRRILATGCALMWVGTLGLPASATEPTFATGYEPSASAGGGPGAGSVVVMPFQDARPARGASSPGRTFLMMIPLVPYASRTWYRTDEWVEHLRNVGHPGPPELEAYRYPTSFARAVATDLEASGVFSSARFDDDPEQADYVLKGALREAPLRRSFSLYGISANGLLFWFLGMPNERMTGTVVLDLELIDPSGRTVWTALAEGRASRTVNLYQEKLVVYGRGDPEGIAVLEPPEGAPVDRASIFSWHFLALRDAMESVRPQLADALRASRTQVQQPN